MILMNLKRVLGESAPFEPTVLKKPFFRAFYVTSGHISGARCAREDNFSDYQFIWARKGPKGVTL